jgi:hypothetical protein
MATIRIHEKADTQEAAEKLKESIYQNYHPCGYGTSLSVYEDTEGKWIVSGHRYSSCD